MNLSVIREKATKFIPILGIVFFFVLYAVYTERVSYNVPHMDEWKGMAERVERYMEGEITFNDWFPIPHGEYFSLLGFPENYTVHVLLHSNFQILTRMGAVFLLLSSIVVYKSYLWSSRDKDSRTKNVYRCLFGVLLLAVYNLNQWEIASFYCAFSFFLRISFYYYLFYYIDRMLHKAVKRPMDYVFGGILCFIAIIVISHAYFPAAIATVALIMLFDYFSKHDWKSIGYYLIVAAFVIASGILYLATYSFGQISIVASDATSAFSHTLVKTVLGTVISVGATWIHQGWSLPLSYYYVAGSAVILLSIVCTVVYFGRKEHKNAYMPVMLLLYGYLSAIIISFTRVNRFGIAYMTTSRYVVETTLILVGNLWMLISIFADGVRNVRGRKTKWMQISVATVCICATCFGLVRSGRKEWDIAPYRKDSFRKMAYNMLNIDYVTDEELGIAQAPAGDVRAAVAALKRYNLSVFHDLPYSEELQSMQIEALKSGSYIPQSGIYSDGWVAPDAGIFVNPGDKTKIVMECYYPFALTGNETITVTVGNVITEYSVVSPDFTISVPVPQNRTSLVKITCSFSQSNPPDIRELSFMLTKIGDLEGMR